MILNDSGIRWMPEFFCHNTAFSFFSVSCLSFPEKYDILKKTFSVFLFSACIGVKKPKRRQTHG